jgi:hypothetical protein
LVIDMQYARIEDGRVAELVELEGDPAEHFHPSLVFVPAPAGCAVGWRLAADVLSAPPPDLAALRAAKLAAIDAAYGARVAAGLTYGGHAWQIDDESRGNIAGLAARAGFKLLGVAGVTWPDAGQPYRALDNAWVDFAPADFLTFAQAVADLYTAIRVRYAGLKDALVAAADQAAIAAVDETVGWP